MKTVMDECAARAAILAGSAPSGLTVKESLDLHDSRDLVRLPKNLTVNGWLDLTRCTGLTSLPDGLYVQGLLDLAGCTGLTSLPEDVRTDAYIELDGCAGLVGYRHPGTPMVENPDQMVLDALASGGSLCWLGVDESTSSRSWPEWIVHLTGDEGRALAERLGTYTAASLIYLASGREAPDFCWEERDAEILIRLGAGR